MEFAPELPLTVGRELLELGRTTLGRGVDAGAATFGRELLLALGDDFDGALDFGVDTILGALGRLGCVTRGDCEGRDGLALGRDGDCAGLWTDGRDCDADGLDCDGCDARGGADGRDGAALGRGADGRDADGRAGCDARLPPPELFAAAGEPPRLPPLSGDANAYAIAGVNNSETHKAPWTSQRDDR